MKGRYQTRFGIPQIFGIVLAAAKSYKRLKITGQPHLKIEHEGK
jgi:hypothetical protein